jgi:hypothetical protein
MSASSNLKTGKENKRTEKRKLVTNKTTKLLDKVSYRRANCRRSRLIRQQVRSLVMAQSHVTGRDTESAGSNPNQLREIMIFFNITTVYS